MPNIVNWGTCTLNCHSILICFKFFEKLIVGYDRLIEIDADESDLVSVIPITTYEKCIVHLLPWKPDLKILEYGIFRFSKFLPPSMHAFKHCSFVSLFYAYMKYMRWWFSCSDCHKLSSLEKKHKKELNHKVCGRTLFCISFYIKHCFIFYHF